MAKAKFSFNFDGLINLLAESLYSEKRVFIREIIQNAHDSILRRREIDKHGNYSGRIDIETQPDQLKIVFRDNGVGMNRAEVQEYLSEIAKSGTQIEAGTARGVIGQFGIGFLSAFLVAGKVEVRTRKLGEEQGWVWINSGSEYYNLKPCAVETPGTTVTISLKRETDRGLIEADFVRQTVRNYCDMLPVPIQLGDSPAPINTMQMPWERSPPNNLDTLIYLEKLNDVGSEGPWGGGVLETIPIKPSDSVHATGILYIVRAKTFVVQPPRSVKIFLKRMFLCDEPTILPKWANFVSGVIDTSDLLPTAARDNFVRNKKADELRDSLGELIIQYLQRLSETNSERF